MKRIYAVILTLTILLYASQFSYSQENVKTKFMIWEVQLSPLQLENAKKAITAENAFYKDHNYPNMSVTQYTNDGYLWYAVPFKDYADLDKMQAASQKLWKDNPEKSKEIGKLFDVSYTKVGKIILESQPELTIQAEQANGPQTGSQFRVFEKFYIKPGMNEKFEGLVKKYVELRKKSGNTSGFYTYYPAFAPDMNVVYFVDYSGSNPSDHFKLNDEQWQKFGDEGQKLWQDVVQVVDKMETHLGQIDFDLMYVPAN